jgi:ketosteroid isomerase-like protein
VRHAAGNNTSPPCTRSANACVVANSSFTVNQYVGRLPVLVPEPSPSGAADIIAIQHLAAGYAEAVSRGNVDEAVAGFAPDGVLVSPNTPDAVGPESIAKLIETATAGLDFLFQTVHLGLVHIDGDRAYARFPITEWARRSADGRGIQFLGVYEDELIRLDVGWRFKKRRLVPRTVGRPEGFDGRIVPYEGLRPNL